MNKTRQQTPASPPLTASPSSSDVVLGIFVGFNQQHQPLVVFAHSPQDTAKIAMNTVATLGPEHVGKQVALLFVNGDLHQPIIMGVICSPDDIKANVRAAAALPTPNVADPTDEPKHLKLSAQDSIELQCGNASLTLNRTGKILLRGQYIASRSAGMNIVKGSTIKIN